MSISQRRKKKTKKKNYGSGTEKLVPEIQQNQNETVSLIEIFPLVTSLEELVELIVEQSNLYAHQNRRHFTVTNKELKVYLDMNFVMAINKLPMIA